MDSPVDPPRLAVLARAVKWVDDPDPVSREAGSRVGRLLAEHHIARSPFPQPGHEEVVRFAIPRGAQLARVVEAELVPQPQQPLAGLPGELRGKGVVVDHLPIVAVVPDRVLTPLERARLDLSLAGLLPPQEWDPDDRLLDDEGAPIDLTPRDVGRNPIVLRGPVAPGVLEQHDHVVLLTDRPRSDDPTRTATVRAVQQLGLPVTVLLDPGPEVTAVGAAISPDTKRGLVVFFTGLSGSGKSTLARALADVLDPPVTLLDGDVVRRHLSRGLGFSREDRDLNVERIGWVAAEVAKHGGTAVCAPIAPYDEMRKRVRRMATDVGADFLLVWVSTPLEVCEARDRKGLYAKARRGELTGFTGIDDPYEAPTDADLVLDTSQLSVGDALTQLCGLVASAIA